MANENTNTIVNENFENYSHVNSNVKALKFTKENQQAIVTALLADASAFLFTTFHLDYDTDSRTYAISFRYKTDTVLSVLRQGDYLVRMIDGAFRRIDASVFEQDYVLTEDTPEDTPSDTPGDTVDDARVDEAVVS